MTPQGSDADEDREEITLPEPDFDEQEYKRDEIQKGKMAVLNTGYGILLAAIAVTAQALFGASSRVGWMVLAVGALGVPTLYRLGNVDVPEWGFKQFATAGITLFFSFLAFWYIFSNPPFV